MFQKNCFIFMSKIISNLRNLFAQLNALPVNVNLHMVLCKRSKKIGLYALFN